MVSFGVCASSDTQRSSNKRKLDVGEIYWAKCVQRLEVEKDFRKWCRLNTYKRKESKSQMSRKTLKLNRSPKKVWVRLMGKPQAKIIHCWRAAISHWLGAAQEGHDLGVNIVPGSKEVTAGGSQNSSPRVLSSEEIWEGHAHGCHRWRENISEEGNMSQDTGYIDKIFGSKH